MGGIRKEFTLKPMKFLLDMCLSPKTVLFLRSMGFDAHRLSEFSLGKAQDREVINYAAENGMVLITMDLDVGYLMTYARPRPSIILLRLIDPSVECVNKVLMEAIQKSKEGLEKGAMAIVSERRIRIKEF